MCAITFEPSGDDMELKMPLGEGTPRFSRDEAWFREHYPAKPAPPAPLPVRWWTCFWGHRWSRWEQYERPIRRIWLNDAREKSFEADDTKRCQRRSCLRCGKMQDWAV